MKFFLSQKKKTLEQFQNVNSKNDKYFDYNGNSLVNGQNVNINLSLNATTMCGDPGENKADDVLDRIAAQLEVRILDLTSNDVYKIIDKNIFRW